LPSSLTRVLSCAWVSSTHLPVSVCGTGALASSLRGFSWPPLQSLLSFRSAIMRSAPGPDFPGPFLTSRTWHHLSSWRLTCRETSPLRSTRAVPDCSPVVHRLRLPASAKARLTRRGLTFRRNPEVFGACGSHACLATHAGILTCLTSTGGSPLASPLRQRSPTAKQSLAIAPPAASVAGFSPVTLSAPPRLTSELLRTL
jgi:hypothetical protein